MGMIKAIALDLDGVLVEAPDLHKAALNSALSERGWPKISEDDHKRRFNGLPTKVKLHMLGFKEGEAKAIAELKQQKTIDLASNFIRPAPDMIRKIQRLAELYPLCCCSNSVRASVDKLLDCAGLTKFMEFTLSNEDVTNPKPFPEIYIQAAVRFNTFPERIFVVEDNPNGILAAAKAGCKICPVPDTSWSLDYAMAMLAEYERQAQWE